METKLSQQLIKQYMTKAYQTAANQGYYQPDTEINQELMLIITEMSEAICADRHGLHADLTQYYHSLVKSKSSDIAYEQTISDTVESEFADIAIRILSLLGWYASKEGINIIDSATITKQIDFHKLELQRSTLNLPTAFYNIITHMTYFPFSCSPSWIVTLRLQEILLQVFALANMYDIDLVEHINLKMKYNESRPYLHGCNY